MYLYEWLRATFDIDKNVAASITVTITIFVCGGILRWIVSIISRYRLRANTRRLYFNCLRKLPKKFNQQSHELQQAIDSLVLDGKKDFYFRQLNYSEIETIHQIPYRELFIANFSGFENMINNLLHRKNREQSFDVLRDILTEAIFLDKQSATGMEVFVQKFNSYTYEISDLLIKFQVFIETNRREVLLKNLKPEMKDFTLELEKVYGEWQTGDRFSSLVAMEESFFVPIKTVCDKHPQTEIYVEIIARLFQMQIIHRNIVRLVENRKLQFGEHKRIIHNHEVAVPIAIKNLGGRYR